QDANNRRMAIGIPAPRVKTRLWRAEWRLVTYSISHRGCNKNRSEVSAAQRRDGSTENELGSSISELGYELGIRMLNEQVCVCRHPPDQLTERVLPLAGEVPAQDQQGNRRGNY